MRSCPRAVASGDGQLHLSVRPRRRVPQGHGVAEVLAHHGVRPEVAPVPEGHARPVGGAPGLESGVLGDSDDADARLAVLVLRDAHMPGALNRLPVRALDQLALGAASGEAAGLAKRGAPPPEETPSWREMSGKYILANK